MGLIGTYSFNKPPGSKGMLDNNKYNLNIISSDNLRSIVNVGGNRYLSTSNTNGN